MNYILDKAFVPQPINQLYLGALKNIFNQSENRDVFISLLENDYKSYDLDYMREEPVAENVKVVLPNVIFGNLGDCIYVFLETLCRDVKTSDCK